MATGENFMVLKRQHVKYYLAGFVSIITFIVYLRTLQNEFVGWDDNRYVFENPHIRSFDVALLKWAFFDFYAGNWHPLAWLSHSLDYAIWGLNPVGHHLTNNILHAVNTFCVVILVIRLVEAGKETAIIKRPSAFMDDRVILITGVVTGLLFGLHPLHVESVAWAAERKDLLCALFFLLSIIIYMKYLDGQKRAVRSQDAEIEGRHGKFFMNRDYLLSLGLFILALLSKSMAVSLPVVLLILDWYPYNKIQSVKFLRPSLVEKIPFAMLSLISSILTYLAQKSGGAMSMMDFVPLHARLLVAATSLIAYLGKTVLPIHLIPFYAYPRDVSFFSVEYFSVIILVVMITVACIILAKKQKLFISVWAYYVVTLVPVLGIVQVGGQAMADRYMYLPSFGPFLLMGLLAARGMSSLNTFVKLACAAATILAFVTVSYLTFEQIGVWRNNMVLWSYVIEKSPVKVPVAYKNRGTGLDRSGRLYEAMKDYDTAIALDDKDALLFKNRGLLNLRLGRVEHAISDFERACALGDSFGCNAPKYLLKNGH